MCQPFLRRHYCIPQRTTRHCRDAASALHNIRIESPYSTSSTMRLIPRQRTRGTCKATVTSCLGAEAQLNYCRTEAKMCQPIFILYTEAIGTMIKSCSRRDGGWVQWATVRARHGGGCALHRCRGPAASAPHTTYGYRQT